MRRPDNEVAPGGVWARPSAAWVAGSVAAVVLLGPALGPGALLSLDLVALPHLAVPEALVGLGHELPRRVPLGALPAWLGAVMGSVAAAKLFLALSVAAGFAGAVRLARSAGAVPSLTAGLLYALGPFAATRLGAGHWAVLAAMAVLPWALPHLARPDRPRATFLWLAAGGLTGVFGGLATGVVALVGTGLRRRRALPRVAALAMVAQLPWLVPSLFLVGGGFRPVSGDAFRTAAEGPLGAVGALLAQHGFWREASQVGGAAGVGLTLVGLGLTAMAAYGTPALPQTWRRPLVVVAALGFGLALAPAVPGVRSLHGAVTDWAPLAPFREPQRFLALFLLWLAPAAAFGARRLGEREPGLAVAAPAFALAAAVALGLPGWWGVGGRLEPVAIPPEWEQAREEIARRPATTLALPWHQYVNLRIADGRRVLNPLPDYLPADVLSSHDPEVGARPAQEGTDEREGRVRELLPRLREPGPVADELRALGTGWVAVLHEADWRDYQSLRADPGLTLVVSGPALSLYRVDGSPPAPKGTDWASWPTAATLAGYGLMIAVGVVVRRRAPRRGLRNGGRPSAGGEHPDASRRSR